MYRQLRSLFRPPRASRRPITNHRLEIEILEARLAPSAVTRVWTGNGGDANWTTAANWMDGANSNNHVAPLAGDRLVFPSGPTQLATVDNLAYPINNPFASLTFNGGGYTISSTNVQGFGVNSLTDTLGQSVTTNTITSPLSLGMKQTFVTVYSHTLDLAGPISGGGLFKTGNGNVQLDADNSTWTGGVYVNLGTVTATNSTALGSAKTLVQVPVSGELNLSGGITIAQPLLLTGTLGNASGANSWSGSILDVSNHSTINVIQGNLTVSGAISGSVLAVTGAGVLSLIETNRFGGLTILPGATVDISSVAALGKATTPINLIGAGTLELLGPTNGLSIPNPLSLGLGATLRSVSGPNTLTGRIGTTIDAIDVRADRLTISGVISGGALNRVGLTKAGEGTLVLTNSNAFHGLTEIKAGVLIATAATALGFPGFDFLNSGVQVDDGATLELQTGGSPNQAPNALAPKNVSTGGSPPTPVAFIGYPLHLTGTGVDGQGALRSVSGINVWQAPVTLFGEVAIAVDALSTLQFGNGLIDTDFFGGLDKIGLGELDLMGDVPTGGSSTLTDANYHGPTTVLQGTLKIFSPRALGGSSDGFVPSNGTTVFGGATLSVINPSTTNAILTVPENLTLDDGATMQLGNRVVMSGSITLAGTPTIDVVAGLGDSLTGQVAGIDGAGINVAATPVASGSPLRVLRLWADNSYNGVTTVQSGDLIVSGSAPTTVIVDAGARYDPPVAPKLQPSAVLVAGDVNIPSGVTLNAVIDANQPNFTYLSVPTGTVTLGGALNLTVLNPTSLFLGESFTLIQNNRTNNLTGRFATANGRPITNNQIPIAGSNGLFFTINYADGPFGDDVTLTISPPPLP